MHAITPQQIHMGNAIVKGARKIASDHWYPMPLSTNANTTDTPAHTHRHINSFGSAPHVVVISGGRSIFVARGRK